MVSTPGASQDAIERLQGQPACAARRSRLEAIRATRSRAIEPDSCAHVPS